MSIIIYFLAIGIIGKMLYNGKVGQISFREVGLWVLRGYISIAVFFQSRFALRLLYLSFSPP